MSGRPRPGWRLLAFVAGLVMVGTSAYAIGHARRVGAGPPTVGLRSEAFVAGAGPALRASHQARRR